MFSPAKNEGIGGRHILGGASVHIKAFDSTPIPLQRQISTEGRGGSYPLSMLGRTLPCVRGLVTYMYVAHDRIMLHIQKVGLKLVLF